MPMGLLRPNQPERDTATQPGSRRSSTTCGPSPRGASQRRQRGLLQRRELGCRLLVRVLGRDAGAWWRPLCGSPRQVITCPLARPRSVRLCAATWDGPGEQRDIFTVSATSGIRRERGSVVGFGRRPAPRRAEVDGTLIEGVEQGGGDALSLVRLVHSELVHEQLQALVGVAHLDAGDEPGRCAIDLCDEQVVRRGIKERGGAICCRRPVEQGGCSEHTLDGGHRTHGHARNVDRSMPSPRLDQLGGKWCGAGCAGSFCLALRWRGRSAALVAPH